MQMKVAKNNLDTGSSRFSVVGGTSACNEPESAWKAVDSAPSDLLGFVRGQSIGSAAAALQLPRTTVYRLIQGYWPGDSRKIMQAWVDYKGRTGRIDSGWFLRRVREGVIKHAGFDWSCEGLMQRSGELVACSKTASGLIAQTLELPATRMQLAQIQNETKTMRTTS